MNDIVITQDRNYRTGHGSTDSVFGSLEHECFEEPSADYPREWRQATKSFYEESTTTRAAGVSFVLGAVSNWTSPRTWANKTINKGATKAAIAQLIVLSNEGLLDESSPQSVQRLLEVAFSEEPKEALSILNETVSRKGLDRAVIYALCDAVGRVTSQKVEALAFLTGLLRSADASIRDAALLGISILDDTRAVPALRQALEREERVLLRETIEAILLDA